VSSHDKINIEQRHHKQKHKKRKKKKKKEVEPQAQPAKVPILPSVINLLVVGPPQVGKSSLILKFTEGTVGGLLERNEVEFRKTTIQLSDDQEANVSVWDTPPEDRFKTPSSQLCRQAMGIMIVFDITSKSSFDQLDPLLKCIKCAGNEKSSIIIVGNKVDLPHREIEYQDAKDFCGARNLKYMETSSLDGHNVEEAFKRLVTLIRDSL